MLINMQSLQKYNVCMWKAEGQWQKKHRNGSSKTRLISHLSSSLSITCFQPQALEMLLPVLLFFFSPDRNGEENMGDDQVSSAASVTQTPTLKRAGESRKPHRPVTSRAPTHKGEFDRASEPMPGWDGVGQFSSFISSWQSWKNALPSTQSLHCFYLYRAWGEGTHPVVFWFSLQHKRM